VDEPFSSVGEDFVSEPSAKVTPIFDQLVEEFGGLPDEPADRAAREPAPERDPPRRDRPSD
jgi:hypothetical protein